MVQFNKTIGEQQAQQPHIEYVIAYGHSIDCSPTRFPLIHKLKPDFLVGILNLPGGKLDEGENPIDAAVRELKEETGLEEIQVYDPMVWQYSAQYMGKIVGTKSIIHCVNVPVSGKQELTPGPDEIEKVEWFNYVDALQHPKLMPNLRIIIPLLEREICGWTLEDKIGTWRETTEHSIVLKFDKEEYNSFCVSVKGMKAF